jgi:hypothetical protein
VTGPRGQSVKSYTVDELRPSRIPLACRAKNQTAGVACSLWYRSHGTKGRAKGGESWTTIASYIINVDPQCTENSLTLSASHRILKKLLARGDFELQQRGYLAEEVLATARPPSRTVCQVRICRRTRVLSLSYVLLVPVC